MLTSMSASSSLEQKFNSIWPLLDERTRRIMAANEAMSLGFGGITAVHRACGLSRKAIHQGIREIKEGVSLPPGRLRKGGGGRKPLTSVDTGLAEAVEALIEDQTRGDPQSPLRSPIAVAIPNRRCDPQSPLRWCCKSTRQIARELSQNKHPVSHTKVAQILHQQNYSLQGNRKTLEGADHPDRDAQFQHINATAKKCLEANAPVISVDTKKKELIGDYANPGRQWKPSGQPVKVQGHDFPGPQVPRAFPYGIYDLKENSGFVNRLR